MGLVVAVVAIIAVAAIAFFVMTSRNGGADGGANIPTPDAQIDVNAGQ